MKQLHTVIMAGGEGSRLRPITDTIPKPLVPVAGEPVMTHILRLLARCGVEAATVSLCYRGLQIREQYGSFAEGIALTYAEESSPRGTAGGVLSALDGDLSRDVLVISGDAVCDFDLPRALAAHRAADADATMVLSRQADAGAFGVVVCDGECADGAAADIRAFVEKPAACAAVSDTVNTGIYFLSPRLLSMIPAGRAYDFGRDLFPRALAEGRRLRGYADGGYWCDIGSLDTFFSCNEDAVEGRVPGIFYQPPIGTALLTGCAVGHDCHIAPSARVKQSVVFDNVTVSAGAVVEGAVLCEGVRIGRGATVGRGCVLGARATVRPGLTVAPGVQMAPGTVACCKTDRRCAADDAAADRVMTAPGKAARSSLQQQLPPEEREVDEPPTATMPANGVAVDRITAAGIMADSVTDAEPEPQHRTGRGGPVFDGYRAVADYFDEDGLNLGDERTPDAVFCARLGTAIARLCTHGAFGIMTDGAAEAEVSAALVAAAVSAAGAVSLSFGEGELNTARFAAVQYHTRLFLFVRFDGRHIYAHLLDENGLYPTREDERALESGLSRPARPAAQTVPDLPRRITGLSELLAAALRPYLDGIGAMPPFETRGVLADSTLRPLFARFGMLPTRHAPLQFCLAPNGTLTVYENEVAFDRYALTGLLLANSAYLPDGRELALPASAPLFLDGLARENGLFTRRFSHCPTSAAEQLHTRRLNARQPVFANGIFLAAATAALLAGRGKSLTALCGALPPYARRTASCSAARGSRTAVLRGIRALEAPGDDTPQDGIRLRRAEGELLIMPEKRAAFRIIADASSAEAAEELIAFGKQTVLSLCGRHGSLPRKPEQNGGAVDN